MKTMPQRIGEVLSVIQSHTKAIREVIVNCPDDVRDALRNNNEGIDPLIYLDNSAIDIQDRALAAQEANVEKTSD